MQIKIRLRGVEAVQAFIRSIPRGGVKAGIAAFAEYMLGDESHGLRHYEPYRFVSPFRSYSPDPKKAARQRGWIFTHLDQIGSGQRSGATAAGWRFTPTNSGYDGRFENAAPGAGWLWGDNTQTRQNQAVGHRTVSDKIASNYLGAVRHAAAVIKKVLGL